MNFHVGQKVVCIYPNEIPGDPLTVHGWQPSEALIRGATYTVRRVFVGPLNRACVWLDEVERCFAARECFGPDVGYAACRFRPLVEKKTDTSIFTRMLTGAPVRISEKVS